MGTVDVVVVGGGPAGCAAAIHAARGGASTVLLERCAAPRDRPGETLHPGVGPLIESLGVPAATLPTTWPRHAGVEVSWGGRRRFERYGSDASGPWLGYQAWRSDLDALLLDQGVRTGVRVIRPCVGLQPVVRAGRVCGVNWQANGLAARWVIDAAGGGHWLARRTGLRVRRFSPPLVARFGYRRGCCRGRAEVPIFRAVGGGWVWTARVRAGLYAWVRLQVDRPTPGVVPADLRHLEPYGPDGGADVTWRSVTEPVGDGYFLVGDAAAVLDPSSSHGVVRALMSGTYAGFLVGKVLAGRGTEPEIRALYTAWLSDTITRDMTRMREFYAPLTGGAPPDFRGLAPGWQAEGTTTD